MRNQLNSDEFEVVTLLKKEKYTLHNYFKVIDSIFWPTRGAS